MRPVGPWLDARPLAKIVVTVMIIHSSPLLSASYASSVRYSALQPSWDQPPGEIPHTLRVECARIFGKVGEESLERRLEPDKDVVDFLVAESVDVEVSREPAAEPAIGVLDNAFLPGGVSIT